MELFRIMNPKLDFENLFKLICQFSREYVSQLNFIALDLNETVDIFQSLEAHLIFNYRSVITREWCYEFSIYIFS